MGRQLTYCFRMGAAFVAAIALWSCGKTSTITYRMKNMASDSILIVRGYVDTALKPDTLSVGYNQEVKVGTVEKGKEHVSTYRLDDGIITYFDSLNVYRITSGARARTDFRSARHWTYKEYSRHTADYTTVVTDADF